MELGIGPAVAGLRVRDHHARRIDVASSRAAWFVTPTIRMLPVPVIVLSRPDDEGNKQSGGFAVGKAIADIVGAVTLSGGPDIRTGRREGTRCTCGGAGLRVRGIGGPLVSRIGVAVVGGLEGGIVPGCRIERQHFEGAGSGLWAGRRGGR